jgi:hypothetical protein
MLGTSPFRQGGHEGVWSSGWRTKPRSCAGQRCKVGLFRVWACGAASRLEDEELNLPRRSGFRMEEEEGRPGGGGSFLLACWLGFDDLTKRRGQ